MTQLDPLIMIIDDTPEDRAAVRRHLSSDGARYRFREYESAATAAEDLASDPPVCLVIDYRLQGTDGLEVLEGLTGATSVAPFAIVMLTGRGSEAVAVQAFKRGAVDYLVKGSYSPAQLRQTVADAIAKFADHPALERQRAERERAHRAAQGSAPGYERLVLIVDDSPEDRMAVRRALAREGGPSYRIMEESTGGDGLTICRSAGIDCLILDYSLPDVDGLEFLQELTGGTGITPFPVIMLTGRGDEAIAVQALKRGAADYLVKGRLGAEMLGDKVEQAIQRVAVRRAREEERVRVLERLEAEARRRADELAEADRRKDEFLAMLAHELRNPLVPVATALHLLRRDLPPSGRARETLEVAERQVKHLARLVDDLMEVSRITRGKITLQKEKLDLGTVLRRSVEAARPLIEAQAHHLQVDLPPEPIHLEADPMRLEQVFTNLVNNAAKYTDPGGRIGIVAGREDHTAVVRVKDTGVGIERDVLPHVFELFAQADRSLDRAHGGLGIGLTLVRTLAELHGGSVEVKSDGAGMGSEFTVRLPAASETEPVAPTTQPESGSPPLRLLIVDDNIDGAFMLATLFRDCDYEVHSAHDGVAGLEAVLSIRPDVVILDIGLPRMNGYDLARAVKAELGDAAPALVAVTGYGQTEDRRLANEAGFRCHMVKPVDPDELLRVIADITRASRPGT